LGLSVEAHRALKSLGTDIPILGARESLWNRSSNRRLGIPSLQQIRPLFFIDTSGKDHGHMLFFT
jgi:hypothetical protein